MADLSLCNKVGIPVGGSDPGPRPTIPLPTCSQFDKSFVENENKKIKDGTVTYLKEKGMKLTMETENPENLCDCKKRCMDFGVDFVNPICWGFEVKDNVCSFVTIKRRGFGGLVKPTLVADDETSTFVRQGIKDITGNQTMPFVSDD